MPSTIPAAYSSVEGMAEEFRLIGDALKRAAFELPAGWQLQLVIEDHVGTALLYEPNGEFSQYNDGGLCLSAAIVAAVDHAAATEAGYRA